MLRRCVAAVTRKLSSDPQSTRGVEHERGSAITAAPRSINTVPPAAGLEGLSAAFHHVANSLDHLPVVDRLLGKFEQRENLVFNDVGLRILILASPPAALQQLGGLVGVQRLTAADRHITTQGVYVALDQRRRQRGRGGHSA